MGNLKEPCQVSQQRAEQPDILAVESGGGETHPPRLNSQNNISLSMNPFPKHFMVRTHPGR